MAATTAMVCVLIGGCGVAALSIWMHAKVEIAKIEAEAMRRK